MLRILRTLVDPTAFLSVLRSLSWNFNEKTLSWCNLEQESKSCCITAQTECTTSKWWHPSPCFDTLPANSRSWAPGCGGCPLASCASCPCSWSHTDLSTCRKPYNTANHQAGTKNEQTHKNQRWRSHTLTVHAFQKTDWHSYLWNLTACGWKGKLQILSAKQKWLCKASCHASSLLWALEMVWELWKAIPPCSHPRIHVHNMSCSPTTCSRSACVSHDCAWVSTPRLRKYLAAPGFAR